MAIPLLPLLGPVLQGAQAIIQRNRLKRYNRQMNEYMLQNTRAQNDERMRQQSDAIYGDPMDHQDTPMGAVQNNQMGGVKMPAPPTPGAEGLLGLMGGTISTLQAGGVFDKLTNTAAPAQTLK